MSDFLILRLAIKNRLKTINQVFPYLDVYVNIYVIGINKCKWRIIKWISKMICSVTTTEVIANTSVLLIKTMTDRKWLTEVSTSVASAAFSVFNIRAIVTTANTPDSPEKVFIINGNEYFAI